MSDRHLEQVGLSGYARMLPKAEVHVHLEGCIPAGLAERVAREHGAASPIPIVEGRPAITSLQGLLDYLDWSCALVDRREHLEEIAYATARRMSESGTLYADVIFNPSHWPHWRERVGEMVGGLAAGFAAAEEDGHTPVGLCLSLKRQQSRSEANEIVDWLLAARPARVIALSIDGNEAAGSHNERFAEAFARAADGGLRRCAHAGESSGADGVREAIEILGAERIDHGIRSIEDASVVAELVERGVPLDICPTSNVVLGVVPNLALHPVEQLRRAGVRVSLNTDDPVLYAIDLAGEYERVATEFRLRASALAEMARVSIEASFAPDELKVEMSRRLDDFLAN